MTRENKRWLLFAIALGLLLGALSLVQTYGLDHQVVTATWYGKPYHGRLTACGERFDKDAYTVACNWLPCGTSIRLTYKNHILYARVNDRYDQAHPANQGWRIDTSEAIAVEMGWKSLGRVDMVLEVVK